MHMRKSAGGKAVYRALGSLAFIAAARMAWLVTRDKEDTGLRLLLPVKCNLCKEPKGLAYRIEDTGVLHWQAAVPTMTADEAVEEPKAGRPKKKDLAVAWFRGKLKNGMVETSALQEAAKGQGFVWRTLERGLAEAGEEFEPHEAMVDGVKRYYWRLKGMLPI